MAYRVAQCTSETRPERSSVSNLGSEVLQRVHQHSGMQECTISVQHQSLRRSEPLPITLPAPLIIERNLT